MKRVLVPVFAIVAILSLAGCGTSYTSGCGTTCPTQKTYVTTTSTCCATCSPCYGYGYSWY